MIKEFSILDELKEIRKQKIALEEREEELLNPRMKDDSKISVIHDLLRKKCKEQQLSHETPQKRKVFILVVVVLFSPKTLFRKPMRHKLRKSISDILSCTETLISKDADDAIFYYKQYSSFRAEVDAFYNEVVNAFGLSE